MIPYRFTSREYDAQTGLYYYRKRYLDPIAARWMSADPALESYLPATPTSDQVRNQNQNLPGQGGVFNCLNLDVYHYAGNNPVTYTDPTGLATNKQLKKPEQGTGTKALSIAGSAMTATGVAASLAADTTNFAEHKVGVDEYDYRTVGNVLSAISTPATSALGLVITPSEP